jgi:hypothetical protein
MNQKKQLNRSSAYKGVYIHKRKYKDKEYSSFVAGITLNFKRLYLGSFKNEIDAAIAYNEAAIKYHGEFANLNIIPEENN